MGKLDSSTTRSDVTWEVDGERCCKSEVGEIL